MTLRGFAPVIDRRCELLILGSFPSEASLAAGVYYAHPRNQFWPILSALLGEPLAGLPAPQRYRRVLAHRVAIWDVLAACEREGSLDADIRDAAANDFDALRRLGPRIRGVMFNGRTAARYERRFAQAGYRTRVLPSTSPAHAGMRADDKLRAWREAYAALAADAGAADVAARAGQARPAGGAGRQTSAVPGTVPGGRRRRAAGAAP